MVPFNFPFNLIKLKEKRAHYGKTFFFAGYKQPILPKLQLRRYILTLE